MSLGTKPSNEAALLKALAGNRYKIGERIKVRHTAYKGTIIGFKDKVDEVQWQGKLPLFIVVELDTGEQRLVSPASIKRTMS